MTTILVGDTAAVPLSGTAPVIYTSTDQYGVPIPVTASTSLLTNNAINQVDIVKPGRRYAVQQPPCAGDVEAQDAGGICLTFRGVAYQNLNPGYNLNTVFPYELRGLWNAEVGPVATASNGVTVHLTPEVQDQIRNRYVDGKAIRVRLAKFKWIYCPPGCCKKQKGCNFGACCACNRRLVIDDYFPVYDILYGKADQEASCPNIATKLCFCPLFYWLCEKELYIDIQDVQVKGAPVKQWMM